jgi:hypothetical protein
MDDYDDVGFSVGDLSGWGMQDSPGGGIDEWLGYAYGNIPDFNAATPEEIDALFGELYGRVPDLNAVSPEELDRALGEAYTAAGVQVPAAKKAGFLEAAKKALSTPAGLAAAGTALYGLLGGGNQPQAAGYKGTIPTLTSVRERIKQPDYVPYSGQAVMGRQFFTPQQYVAPGEAATTRTAAQETAKQMESAIPKAPAAAVAPNTLPENKSNPAKPMEPVTATGILQDFLNRQSPAPTTQAAPIPAAQGGIMYAAKGRYLRGETDGMADKIPSSIDGVQPAALSHGEFVIPADVVSHLGNGNSDAGAEQLYKMMDRVRKDRTGTTKQGKKINPGKYLGGGIADYASGGVAKFQTGGSSSLSGLSPSGSNPFGSTATTTLAPYVGDYATGMLGRAQALAQSPYEAYTGPLTAGTSPLQQQAFTAAGELDPSKRFGTEDLQTYMNPYTQLALQPQLDELRRQSAISQANLQGQFSKAGAFGGGREAIARTENLRNLGQLQAGVIGKGFENAFNQAMQQYNVGQQQQLSGIGALAGLGAQQRGIEQEGISALQKQFEQEKMDPYTKLQFQQSMMQGLPTGTTSVTPNLSELGKAGLTLEQANKIYDVLKKIPGFGESITP